MLRFLNYKFSSLFFALIICLNFGQSHASSVDSGGGMDGGGGVTLPVDPADAYEVEQVAQIARPKLLLFLNAIEVYDLLQSSPKLREKLFEGPVTVQDALKNIRLEFRSDTNCKDRTGNEVDASIFGLKPNTICLSSNRIGKKLSKLAVFGEVTALLAHEVSHFMGATEDEAQKLQIIVRDNVISSQHLFKNELLLVNVRFQLESASSTLTSALQKLVLADYENSSNQIIQFKYDFSKIKFHLDSRFELSLFNGLEMDYHDFLLEQLRIMAIYLDSISSSGSAKRSQFLYEDLFKGSQFIEFGKHNPYNKYVGFKIYKSNTPADATKELKRIQKELDLRTFYLISVGSDTNWLSINGHLTAPAVNPFEKFVGEYQVTQNQCDKGGFTRTKITISNDEMLKMRYEGNNFTSEDILEFGNYLSSGNISALGGSDSHAYFSTDSGGSWERRQAHLGDRYVNTTKIEKLSDTDFSMTLTTKIFFQNMKKADTISSCKIAMKKVSK
jgi:hypothetical protein